MKTLVAPIAVALLLGSGSAFAAGIGLRAGTTGIGADVAWSIAPTFAARVGYSALDYDRSESTSSVRYDGKLKLSGANAFLDFSPLGPFRISGGLIFNDNKFNVRGASNGGAIAGDVKFDRRAAPYLGIGYGNVAGLGVNVYADLGVLFMGQPKARLGAECGSLSPAQCGALQAQAVTEQARLEDKVRKYRYYPVANIGLTIGF